MPLEKCPKCKLKTLNYIHGCGWDYDRKVCMSRFCEYEEELEVTSYPENMEEKQC